MWNHGQEQRHRWRNRLQTGLLLGGMGGLLALCGWVVGGPDGVVILGLGGALLLMVAPSLPPAVMLRLVRARPVAPWQWPDIYDSLTELARRAELERVPVLYLVPSLVPNAFTLGGHGQSAIAVTEGLLARLDRRELLGVLAHEVSHIRHGDIRIMGLADMISRLTRLMSWLGALLLLLTLPLLASGGGAVPLPLVALLVASPTLSALLQLALSRTREFDADRDAARLTGDPLGLVSALEKMDAPAWGLWGRIWMPRRQDQEPSLLRTHPATAERVERLLALTRAVDGAHAGRR